MFFVVRQSWTGEEGAHGLIVLVTGLWLLFRRWKEVSGLARVAPSASVWALLACLVPLQIFARITQIVEIEGYLMYACRSEEHTSELKSLMRISYAVFCLKKKKKKH